ncbi:hypothetical protein [Pedobacter frigiditerrae]|uniref:hypothetical protein n=1 Tax=Pedobacter frigiditerrae TaxID=2530452 RepID=UPI00292E6A73|nr:hypothetical protein [Pedobacter frigiditerrae]
MLLLVNSCRKDKSQNLPLSKTELIAEAQSYFKDEIVNLPQLNDNNLRHSLDKTPLWDKASTRKISIGDAVIVPISYEQKIKIGYEDSKDEKELEKTSYLMLYRDKEQKMQAEWVTLLPTATSNGKKFVGTLIIEQWNGKFKRGYAIGDDEEIFSIEPSGEQIFKKIAYKRREYCFTINHYGYIRVGGYNGPQQLLGSESFCSGTANNGETQKTYGSSEGGGGGPEDYTYTIDCNYAINGTATWNTDCQTCIGGNTGITACADIKNQLDSFPCAKALVNQMSSLNSDISNLINQAFNKNDKTNLVFKPGMNLAGTAIDGQYTGVNKSGDKSFIILI